MTTNRRDVRQFRGAKIEAGNVVEVVNLPEGDLARRFSLTNPVQDVAIDPSGSQLMVTAADRSVSVYDVNAGLLLNEFHIVQGPVPQARFGEKGEVILSQTRLGLTGADLSWQRPESMPIASIPVRPGTVSTEEIGQLLDAGRIPVPGRVPLARMINAPAYADKVSDEGDAVSVDVSVVSAPWNEQNRLVRIALQARSDVNIADNAIVAEDLGAEVEFNPARVVAYRAIGFEPSPSSTREVEGERPQLNAGELNTFLFEIEPVSAEPEVLQDTKLYRYQNTLPLGDPAAAEELLTVSLNYQVPGQNERRQVEHPVGNAVSPIAEASDAVRLSAAIAWFGLAIAGALGRCVGSPGRFGRSDPVLRGLIPARRSPIATRTDCSCPGDCQGECDSDTGGARTRSSLTLVAGSERRRQGEGISLPGGRSDPRGLGRSAARQRRR